MKQARTLCAVFLTALLTPGVGTPVEILRFAQDDTKKSVAEEFGIWTLTRRSMTSVGLVLSGRGYSEC
jgi:hypothetical protein